MSPAQLIAIPVLLVLPGYACLRMFVRPRGGAFFLCVPLSVPLTSISGFLLSMAGVFSLSSLMIATLALTGLLWGFPAKGDKTFLSNFDFRFAAVLGVICAGLLWYYGPPFEYYLGGRDPGIYVVNGIRIAKAGTPASTDPIFAAVDPKCRNLFFSDK